MTFERDSLRDALAQPLEDASVLDSAIEPLQAFVRRIVPEDSAAKEALSGTWLGHPLHPLLTDVVIGAWTSAWLLDLLGGRSRERAADDLVAVGVLSAVPTALSGAADWAELRDGTRRVGAVHGAGNAIALGLHASSWLLRRRGSRGPAVALSTLGIAISGLSAWLGGHLSFGRGIGVDQTVFEDLPPAWTSLIDDEKLEAGELVRRSAHGTGVLLVRRGKKIHALVDRCSHRGCSLSEGSFDGKAITCACHGSRFGLDGSLLRGPATSPQPVLETRVRDGRVEVRAPQSD